MPPAGEINNPILAQHSTSVDSPDIDQESVRL